MKTTRSDGRGLFPFSPHVLLTLVLGLASGCGDYPAKVGPRTGTAPAPTDPIDPLTPDASTDTTPDASTDTTPARDTDSGSFDTTPDSGDPTPATGAALFSEHCASCHGNDARGHTAVALRPWTGERSALVDQIATNMPPFAPERCDLACAEAIADWLLTELPPLTCDAPTLAAPSLRLLSRRELLQTLRDLFDTGTDPDCGRVAFAFTPPGAANSVVVAGSFNGWAPTAAQGGWPLAKDGATWRNTFEVAPGSWQYKFVVDGQHWHTDPQNPQRVDDTYGGFNSVVTVDCQAPRPIIPDGDTLVAAFPPEVRPHGFAFDTWAEQVVTADHVESWLSAASLIADGFVAELPRRLPCSSSGGTSCAGTFVDTLAPRAWRRPITTAERTRLVALVTAEPSFSDGVRVALRVMLTAPDFLYRSELGHDQGGVRVLTAIELASALSYALTGTMPDAPLMAAATSGTLTAPATLRAQAARLLETPAARRHLASFFVSWLGADRVSRAVKNPNVYPGFTEALRESILEETRAFAEHVVFEGSGRFAELFTADYTFADQRLAQHYGLPSVTGETPKKVTAPPDRQAGLLAHASVLATTAHSDQTSPILRGLFVRERLLCQTFGAPPPDAGGLPPVDPNATTRERFRQHTDNDACRSCHQYIDDLGFGFEHFDGVGRWRDTEGQPPRPIDARGNLNDREGFGTNTDAHFEGLPALGRLVSESPTARACFAKQLARHTLGAFEKDRCAMNELERRFEQSGGDIKALVLDLVTSQTFTTRATPPTRAGGTP